MTITTDGIVAACTGLLAVFAVIGLAVRLMLLPYLRTHLVNPVAEVHEQVKNTHSTNLRSDLDDMQAAMKALGRDLEQARFEDRQRWRDHMAYSDALAARVIALEARRIDPPHL